MSARRQFESILDPHPLRAFDAWTTLADWDALLRHVTAAMAELDVATEADRREAADHWDECGRRWVQFWSAETQAAMNALPATAASPPAPALPTFCHLLAVSAEVLRNPDVTRLDAAPSLFASPMLRDLTPLAQVRARGWARLLQKERIVSRSIVPIALIDQQADPPHGVLALLELTLLEEGSGVIAAHPALDTAGDAQFVTSMEDAWHAARALIAATVQADAAALVSALPDVATESVSGDLSTSGRDGVWRVFHLEPGPGLRRGARLVAHGASAGAAAARGWWFALAGKLEDNEIVVCAEVARDTGSRAIAPAYGLTGIDVGSPTGQWVQAKVRAVAADRRFDTVVLVDDEKRNRHFVSDGFLRQLRDETGSPLRVIWLDAASAGTASRA